MYTHSKSIIRRIGNPFSAGRLLLVILAGLFLTPAASGQYQVTVSISVSPPYTAYINDYIAQPRKIAATLINTSKDVQTVYVTGSFSGDNGVSIFSEPGYKMPSPIELNPGKPYRLNLDNIEQVFSTSHLIFRGISKDKLLSGGSLPEGEYTICLRVFDYQSGKPASAEDPQGCSNPFTISDIEPPVIMQPECGEPVKAITPQNVVFSWSKPPGSPANTQYILKVVDVQPEGLNINDAVQSAMYPLFFEKTLNATTYLMGPADPTMVTGRTYAFYVTAVDPSKKLAFRNKGMSEVCSLVYGGKTIGDEKPVETQLAEIELLSPKDSLSETRPTFRWRPVKNIPKDVTYTLTIVPLPENASPEEAIKKTNPVFTLSGIKETMLTYPKDAAQLDSGKFYVWGVDAMNPADDATGGKTSIASGCKTIGISTSDKGTCYCHIPIFPIITSTYRLCQNSGPVIINTSNIPSFQFQHASGTACFGIVMYKWDNEVNYGPFSPLHVNPSTLDCGTYIHTLYAWKEGAVCSFTITFYVYPSIKILKGGIPVNEVCSGDVGTLSLCPGFFGQWGYTDIPEVGSPSPYTPWVNGNNVSTNAIVPNCTNLANHYVTRKYTATITGGSLPSPIPPCASPASYDLKVWCPTVAGQVDLTFVSGHTMTTTTPYKICSYNIYPIRFNLALALGSFRGNIISWNPPLNPVSTNPYPDVIEINQAGNYSYSVTVQNGTCHPETASISFTVEDLFTPVITEVLNITEVCPDDDATLHMTNGPQPPGVTLEWEFDVNCTGVWHQAPAGTGDFQNTNPISSSNPIYAPYIATGTPFTKLCWRLKSTSPTCGDGYSNIWQIDIIQPPMGLSISVNPAQPMCPGPAVLTAVGPSGTGGPFTYAWYKDFVTPVGTGQTCTVTQEGFYRVIAFNRNECESIKSDIQIKFCKILIVLNVSNVCYDGNPVTIQATVSADCGPVTYEWSGPGVPPGSTNSTLVITPPSTLPTPTYTVTVTDSHSPLPCTKSASVTILNCQPGK